jgi:hypothetical protein
MFNAETGEPLRKIVKLRVFKAKFLGFYVPDQELNKLHK